MLELLMALVYVGTLLGSHGHHMWVHTAFDTHSPYNFVFIFRETFGDREVSSSQRSLHLSLSRYYGICRVQRTHGNLVKRLALRIENRL